jgi:hypothetical protein
VLADDLRHLELGADAVGAADEDRVDVARGFEVEEPAEAADDRVGAGALGGFDEGLDELDQRVARLDVDARRGVGHPFRLTCLHGKGPVHLCFLL